MNLIDERFWEHRRRSTSVAGVLAIVVAILLFAYRYYFDHRWSWDLLAVALTGVGTKLVLMTWYSLKD